MSWAGILCIMKKKNMANTHFPIEKNPCLKDYLQSLEGASRMEWVFQKTASAHSIEAAHTGNNCVSSLDECRGLLGSPYTIIPLGRGFDYKCSHSLRMITCLFGGLREQKTFDFIVGDGGF